MESVAGQALSWELKDGIVELALHRAPCNEIGSLTLEELERFTVALKQVEDDAHALIIYSTLKSGFCAGADLRELYHRSHEMNREEATRGVRDYLERIHRVMNAIDTSPLTTIAAVHGVTFGGGFELALTCDLIIADKMARFCSGIAVGVDSGIWRYPATEARFGKCGGSRLVADWAKF